MRMSKMMLKTLREPPSEAELASHKLLLRAGLVTSLAAGLYAFTPLGWKVLRKLENIIREEMDGIGAQEVRLPELNPIELWEQSGRAESMGQTLFRLADRKERGFVLGPTHEEGMSFLASRHIQSYRDMPVTLYQIQTKFRDEAAAARRPRTAARVHDEGRLQLRHRLGHARRFIRRSAMTRTSASSPAAGVPVIPVAADSGAIGGKESQEFIFLDGGRRGRRCCSARDCGYAANAEKADFTRPPADRGGCRCRLEEDRDARPARRSPTSALSSESRNARPLKAVFYKADGEPVFVAIRGDLDVNEIKLQNALKAQRRRADGRSRGEAAGPGRRIGFGGRPARHARSSRTSAPPRPTNLVAGANEARTSTCCNTNHGRDWKADVVATSRWHAPATACATLRHGARSEARNGDGPRLQAGHACTPSRSA